jgi:hypothetical protein
LRAQDALIEVINGGVFIKVPNLKTGVRAAYENANLAAGGSKVRYDQNGNSYISNAISTKIGSITFNQSMLNVNSNNILPKLLPNPSPQNPDDQLPLADAPPDAPRIPAIDPATRAPFDLPYSLPSAGVRGAAKGVAIVDVAVFAAERIQSWLISSEQDNIQNQVDKYLTKAYDNLNEGIRLNLVPKQYRNTKDLSSILNVILSGENNSGNKDIYKIGMKIYDKFKSIRLEPAKGLDFMQNNKPVILSQPKPSE